MWTVGPDEAGKALAAYLRGRHPGEPWSVIKRWIASGKVFVDGERADDEGKRVRGGQEIEVRMAAPRRRPEGFKEVRIVHEDPQVIVIDKPSGVSSVPYEEHETGTAMDLIRDAWRRMGRPATSTAILVVHRIDKETSGLLAYAKTKKAEIGLGGQFRAHSVERKYVCVVHGAMRGKARIESYLIADRGDGLRGSTRFEDQGKRAITHVTPVRVLAGGRATLCEVVLETGKTHQIRIHLSERGHPLVGEKVYSRDFLANGGVALPAPRLLLHAQTLAFLHPTTDERIAFESPLPDDFQQALDAL